MIFQILREQGRHGLQDQTSGRGLQEVVTQGSSYCSCSPIPPDLSFPFHTPPTISTAPFTTPTLPPTPPAAPTFQVHEQPNLLPGVKLGLQA